MGWYDAIAGRACAASRSTAAAMASAKPHKPDKYDRIAMARRLRPLDHAAWRRHCWASMGAHIALVTAMTEGGRIDHLVVAGGRPDLRPPRIPMAKAIKRPPRRYRRPDAESFRHFADEQKENPSRSPPARVRPNRVTKDTLFAVHRPTLVIAGARGTAGRRRAGCGNRRRQGGDAGRDHSMIAHGLFRRVCSTSSTAGWNR